MIAGNHEKIYRDIVGDILKFLPSEANPYALYFGNWMADFSQMYSPDLSNTLIKSVITSPQALLDLLKKFATEIEKHKNELAKSLLDELINRLATIREPSYLSIATGLTDLMLLALIKANYNELANALQRELNENLFDPVLKLISFANKYLPEIQELFESLAKNKKSDLETFAQDMTSFQRELMLLLALRKFSNPANHFGEENGGPKLNHIPPASVITLFDKHFGFYKPYEHLDRFIDPKKTHGKNTETNADFYRENAVPIVPHKSYGIDQSLSEDLAIAIGRVEALKLVENVSIDEKLLLLGRSLHAVEDYFAHTNFVDRQLFAMGIDKHLESNSWEYHKMVLSIVDEPTAYIYELSGKKKNSTVIRVTLGEIPISPKPPKKSQETYPSPKKEYVKVEQAIANGIDGCVKPAFFSSVDAAGSLLHLLEGKIQEALELSEDEKDSAFTLLNITEQLIKSKTEGIIKKFETAANTTELKKYQAAYRTANVFETQDLQAALKHYGVPMETEHQSQLLALVNSAAHCVFFVLYAREVGSKANAVSEIKELKDVLITIFRVLRVIYFSKNKIKATSKFLGKLVPDTLKDVLSAMLNQGLEAIAQKLIDKIDAHLEKTAVYGGHLLMAKDERHAQQRLYAVAEGFAVLTDKAVLQYVFGKPYAKNGEGIVNSASDAPPEDKRLKMFARQVFFNPLTKEQGDNLDIERKGFVRDEVTSLTVNSVLSASAALLLKESEGLWMAAPEALDKLIVSPYANKDMAVRAMLARMNAADVHLEGKNFALSHQQSDSLQGDFLTELPTEVWVYKQRSAKNGRSENVLATVEVSPWQVQFVKEMIKGMKGGDTKAAIKNIDWDDYSLDMLTKNYVGPLFELDLDYSEIAKQKIQGYQAVWHSILAWPGTDQMLYNPKKANKWCPAIGKSKVAY